jgi:tetratricopeptide (TPR) repeat protein
VKRTADIGTVVEAWVAFAEIEEQFRTLTKQEIDAAETLLAKLVSDPPQARGVLADAKNTNAVAALLVRSILVEMKDGEAPVATPLVKWLSLVAEFCRGSLFASHAAWLEGCLGLLEVSGTDAQPGLEKARIGYEAVPDTQGLRSTVAVALGILNARRDDKDDARASFETARALASETAPQTWQDAIEALVARWEGRWKAVELLAADPDCPREAIVAVSMFDSDLAHAMRTRAIRNLAKAPIEQTVLAARAASRIAAEAGDRETFVEMLAEFALSRGALDAAEALLRSSLKATPHAPKTRFVLARTLAAQGRFDDAETEFRSLIASHPDDAAARRELGVLLAMIDRFDVALVELANARDLDPSDPMTLLALNQLSPPVPGVRFDPATGTLGIDPAVVGAVGDERMGALITAAMIQANPRTAVDVLAESEPAFAAQVRAFLFPGLRPQDESHLARAESLFTKRRFREAIDAYRLAIDENPQNADAYMGLGDCHYHLGEFDLAAAFFEESIQVLPKPSTYRFLGDAHRSRGRIDDARKAYEAALALDPRYDLARAAIAQLDRGRG